MKLNTCAFEKKIREIKNEKKIREIEMKKKSWNR